MARYRLDTFDRIVGGEKGGASTSPAKVRAARQNGRRGGRPRGPASRPFLDYLLRRKHTRGQHKAAQQALLNLLAVNSSGRTELARFAQRFSLQPTQGSDLSTYAPDRYDLSTLDYRVPRSAASPEMATIVARFKIWARHYIKQK